MANKDKEMTDKRAISLLTNAVFGRESKGYTREEAMSALSGAILAFKVAKYLKGSNPDEYKKAIESTLFSD